MEEQCSPAKPAWQIEELEEEWIDLEEHEQSDHQTHAHSTSDLSFTQTHGYVLGNSENGNNSPTSSASTAGTVFIREDVPAAPFLPQTPANAKKMVGKNFFSPLALERMFEPPSPPMAEPEVPLPTSHRNAPVIPSRLSRMYVPSEGEITSESLDGLGEADMEESVVWANQREESLDETTPEATKYEFTFAAPGLNAVRPHLPFSGNPTTPQPFRTVSSTPSHLPVPPPTDPRLKLFQFQYDTFTRDHLSAMVDSIAIHSPAGDSGTANSKDSSPSAAPSLSDTSISRLRSAKRLKLSPASDFSGDGEALIFRPQSRKDYVGESRSLMDKIRQARDFSTMSTHTSALTPFASEKRPKQSDAQTDANHRERVSYLNVPNVESKDTSSAWTAASSKRGIFSSLQFREQAADLMAQIRNDVRSHKRLFSQDSEPTPIRQGPAYNTGMDSVDSVDIEPIDYGDDTEIIPEAGAENTETLDIYTSSTQPNDVNHDLSRSVGELSLDSPSLLEQFPPLPMALVISSSSTESHISAPSAALSGGQGVSKPNYLSPHTGGFSLAHPSTSSRVGVDPDDLNRFVSSSTASGATMVSGTTASIVRQEGRPIKLITPDSQMIPERLGEMMFDKRLKKWVKANSLAKDPHPAGVSIRTSGSNESEDPFRDIESLHEDNSPTAEDFRPVEPLTSSRVSSMDLEASRYHETPSDTEAEDAEEVELTSFSFDGNSLQTGVAPPPGHQYDDAVETDSEEDLTARRSEGTGQFVIALANSFSEPPAGATSGHHAGDSHQSAPALQDTPPHLLAPPSSSKLTTPLPPSRQASLATTPVIRSALKSNSVTPVSVLRNTSRSRIQTPANRLVHKRSVSFSDGKRDGPIVGIGRNIPTPDVTAESDCGSTSDIASVEHGGAPLVSSARSKRIADMLEDLEDTSYDDDSPSKASSGRPPSEEIEPLARRRNNNTPTSRSNGVGRGRPRRSLSHSHSARSLRFAGGNANATFLTECSFGVAHDRLVQVITDVQPFEPYWDGLSSVDLSRKELDSVARLKEFLPKLDSLTLNSNQLAWLSGIPGTVRTLSVASNCHLLNLESLDISNNHIDSLRQLECLRHLRELRADGNMIDSVDGLQKMDGLVKLSLQGNDIQSIDLAGYHWTRLEMLNLSQNKLSCITGISTQSLPALIAMNLDDNNLRELEVEGGSMARLKILRVSGNRLQQLNAGPFPNVRTLYADNNCLGPILKAHRLTKLENLSLRNQSGRAGLSLTMQDVRDVKRLYLSGPRPIRAKALPRPSFFRTHATFELTVLVLKQVVLYPAGNPMKDGFMSEPCYNLIYLELAACRVTSLPSDLSRLTPNLRVLNLNYNFLEDVRPLQGLTRLRKLTIIGSRVKGTREFVRILRGMLDVEMLDFRTSLWCPVRPPDKSEGGGWAWMNPCTLGWYLPLLVKDVPGALQPSDDNEDRRSPTVLPRTSPSSRTASSSSASTAVGSGRRASSLASETSPANPRERIEFNVSCRGDGAAVNGKPPRGANGASASTSDGGGGDQHQPESADRAAAREDGVLPPPRARSSTPTIHSSQRRVDGRVALGVRAGSKPKSALGGVTWKDLDAKFRRDLPDEVYAGRLVYRGLVMRACPRIRTLDGVDVSEKERDKAERLLESVFDRRSKPLPPADAAAAGRRQ
ncbi:hypothetical protein BC835DRAFT_1308449 [Cytidiella melzeri]|nr:hypothetical protein BC835DRAFT_1308449 [Cytidiella melzeri]